LSLLGLVEMIQIILILHLLFALSLIGLVLLQKGKGAQMGAAFGSGASQTVFGSKGSLSFLIKLTIFIAVCFFGTSIGLTYLATKQVKPATKQADMLTTIEQMSKWSQNPADRSSPQAPVVDTVKKVETLGLGKTKVVR
jgi:preprotein translocase subunit SecG